MIAIVVPSVRLGGSESLALSLAAWMKRAGLACEIIFLEDGPGPAISKARSIGVPVHVIDEASLSRARFVAALRGLLKRRQALHVLAFMFGTHLYVAVAARWAGAGDVLAFVGNPAPADVRRRRRTRRRARLAQPFVSSVIACSHHVETSILSAYGLKREKVQVVWNWCDVDGIARRRDGARKTDRSHETVGMIARLDQIKDHPTLIRAFASVIAERRGVHLRIAGEGPTRPLLERSIEELGLEQHVSMVGAVDDAAEELARLSVFVLSTTEEEGFGVVLIEAMAAGIPIVATDVGPIGEVLDGQRGGRLVPSGDPDALARAILDILDNPELGLRMAHRARQLARSRYSVEVAGARLREVMDL